MTFPLASVIMPARNAEGTVGNAIASVLEQTMPSLELIVVDDASTDQTADLVSQMRDPRIRLLRCKKNIRCAAARNLGLRNAHGKWVTFLDADDEWSGRRLQFLLSAAQGREDCYVADRELLAVPGPSGRLVRFGAIREPEDGILVTLDLEGALKLGHDVRPMVPRSAFTRMGIEFPEWASGGEWIFLLARLSAQGMEGRLVRHGGYLYRAQASHDSSTLRAKKELLSVLEILAAEPSLSETTKRHLSKKVSRARQGIVATALRHGDAAEFLAYARRYPRAVLPLPLRGLRFAAAKARVRLAMAVASRRGNPTRRN
jgi:succinoglycan biosynthesis protein ExoO